MISRAFSVRLTSLLHFTRSLLISQLLVLPAYSAPLYKWVDETGQIRYSDKLPSKQSSKRFQTMTPSGRILNTKEASKSPEQLKAERAEKKQREEEARKKAELAAIQDHHDNVLLMTYTHEGEILAAQNERLAVIDSVIKLLNKNVETEQAKLHREEQRAKELYLDKNREVPGGLAQKVEYFTDKVLSKQQQLSIKLAEREKVKQQYVQDLIRYRELKELKKKEK